MEWFRNAGEARLVVDVAIGTLLAGLLRLVVWKLWLIAMKAFIEPAAVWLGRRGYGQLRVWSAGRLPVLFPPPSPPPSREEDPLGAAPDRR